MVQHTRLILVLGSIATQYFVELNAIGPSKNSIIIVKTINIIVKMWVHAVHVNESVTESVKTGLAH